MLQQLSALQLALAGQQTALSTALRHSAEIKLAGADDLERLGLDELLRRLSSSQEPRPNWHAQYALQNLHSSVMTHKAQ